MTHFNKSHLLAALQPATLEDADLEYVSSYNRLIDNKIQSASATSKAAEAEAWRLRADLGPLCIDGNPDAQVIYLQANPSFGADATRQSHYQPNPDFQLSVAGSNLPGATRTYYHDEVFKHLRLADVSLQAIGRNLLKVELCPWASKKWPRDAALQRALAGFPSRKPIGQFVEHLVDRGAIFIMARAWIPWFVAVPSLKPLIGTRVFQSRSPVSPYISRGAYPTSWDRIVAALAA